MAAEARIPAALALACAVAESGLNPRAERWGRQTGAAVAALERGDRAALARIVSQEWPDISFGYGQRIVLYGYLGDRSPTVANCLDVRLQVFANPERDLEEMARRLDGCLEEARAGDLAPVDGDVLLGALVVYNAGHLPARWSEWWDDWAGNVAAYRAALERASGLLAESRDVP